MSDFLNYLGSCPLCHRRLRAERATVIEETSQRALLEADCASCAASLLLTVMRTDAGLDTAFLPGDFHRDAALVTTVGMVTDLTAGDAKKILRQPAITVDDVLELHDYLKKRNKNGDH